MQLLFKKNMKTEKEILKKYYEMLDTAIRLYDIVNSPPDNYTFNEIKEAICDENTQLSMISLIEWVMDIKNKTK